MKRKKKYKSPVLDAIAKVQKVIDKLPKIKENKKSQGNEYEELNYLTH